MNNKGYETIDSIVRSYLADQGYNTLHKYIQYLHWGLKALRIWNMDSAEEVKTVKLSMDARKAIKLPDDYINWIKVGIKVGDRIDAFVNDNSIALHHEKKPMEKPKPNEPYCKYRFMNYRDGNGKFLGYVDGYGYGHNGVGYFRVNEALREIQFSAEVNRCSVLLEYVSDGFNPHSETLVNMKVSQLITEYIRYSEARYKLGDSASETRARKEEYIEEQLATSGRFNSLSLEGILDATTTTFSLNIK